MKEIAQRLFIGEATVANHLTVIFSKLEVADGLGLLLYAFHQGLIKSPSRRGGDEPTCATCC